MKWLTNLDKDSNYFHDKEWLEDKLIGDPKATPFYTVEQLKDDGLVGIYVFDDKEDKNI